MLTKKILSTLDADWEPAQPKKLAKIVAKLARWPKDLAVLYDFSGGGTVGTVDVFDLEELADVNLEQSYPNEISGSVFFASDGGDGFFYVDAKGAVHWMDRGASSQRRKAAKDVATFLRKAEKLTTPWPKPKSKKAKKDPWAFFQFLKDHPELYEGPRQTSEMPLSSASRRCNIRISGDLDDLYRFTDGMRIARAGITFHRSSEIMAVEGSLEDERYHLMWIGQDDDGNRIAYVPAAMGWRGFGEGHVVLVPKGGDPLRGKDLGALDEVVLGWLQSERGDREREPEKRAARPRRNPKR